MRRVFVTGPALSGSTTSAAAIRRRLQPDEVEVRAKLPIARWYEPSLTDEDVRVREEAAFLQGADLICFVAESQHVRHQANAEALERLGRVLESLGRDRERVPIVFLLNKRDCDELTSVEDMMKALVWPRSRHVPTVATQDRGFDQVVAAIHVLLAA